MKRIVTFVSLLICVAQSAAAATVATNALGQAQTFSHDDAGLLSGYADEHGAIGIGRAGDNQISQITDRMGGLYSFEYDTNHNVTAFTDPLSNRVSVSYNAFRQPLTVTNALGAVWVNSYDGNGNLLENIDPLGHRAVRTCDIYGQVTSLTDARGNVTRQNYDALGNVTNVVRPGGITTRLDYDSLGRVVATRDPEGGVMHLVYDAAGNVLAVTNALQQAMRFAYDGNGNMTNAVDPRGYAVTRVFDAANRLVETRNPDGGCWRNEYDANGNLVAVIDPLSNRSSRAYLQGGLLALESNTVGLVTRFFYDGQGRVITNSLPGGRLFRSVYDKRGKTVRQIDPLNNTTAYAYDPAGRLVAVTNAIGAVTRYAYDALDRLVSVTNALDAGTTMSYDANGNVTALTDALGNTTTFEYDALNRLAVKRDPLGNTVRYRYDGNGRAVEETSPRGTLKTMAYDAAGRLARATDALGNAVAYTYNETGQLSSLTNARDAAWSWNYDPMGRVTSERDANGNVTSNRYDRAGNLIEKRTPSGAVIRFGYDAANRLKIADYGSFSNTVAYNENGFLSRVDCGPVAQTRHYDLAGRLTGVNTALVSRVGYEYDAAGRRTRLVYPDGKALSYAYDLAGRCTNMVDWLSRKTRFEYDAADRLTLTVHSNGIEERRTYDAAGRMTAISHTKGTNVLVSLTYAYDAAGNPKVINTVSGLQKTLHSGAQTGTYDADNRVTQFGTNGVYASDRNGNVTNYTGSAGATALAYDERDLLTRIQAPQFTVTNIYNGLGQRVSRTRNGVVTRFVLEVNGPMEQVLADTDASDVIQRYYIHGPGGLLYSLAPNNALRTYHGDLTGNILAIGNNFGAVSQRYAYDPYGRVLASSGAIIDNDYQYVGKYGVMAEGGDLVFMRARYYSTEMKRFIGKDLLTGYNRFAYVNNNPLLWLDPSGLIRVALYDALESGSKGLLDASKIALLANAYADTGYDHAFFNPIETLKYLKDIRRSGETIDTLYLFDHGVSAGQEMGNFYIKVNYSDSTWTKLLEQAKRSGEDIYNNVFADYQLSLVWKKIFSLVEEDGLIAFMGCSVAEGDSGQSYLQQSANLTGRKFTGNTGNGTLTTYGDGSWEYEYKGSWLTTTPIDD